MASKFGGIPLEKKSKFGGVSNFERVEQELSSAPYLSEQERVESESQVGRMPLMELLTGKERETELTKTLPEFRETPPIKTGEMGLKGTKMAIGILSTFDPEGQMNVIKDAIPNAKFFVDEKDNIIVDVDGERSVLNKPGFSKQDAVQALTSVLAFAPAAKLAGLGKTIAQKLGIGAVGAGITEQSTQEVSRAAGSEVKRDPIKTGIAAGLGGLTEIIGPTRQFMRQRKAAKQLGTSVPELIASKETARVAQEASGATGVPLFDAQKTAIPSQLEKQSFVATLPAGAQKASKALKEQNKASYEAVEDFLMSIAPDEAVVTGAERFRTASQKAVDAQKAIRKERTSKLFDNAFKDKSPVDISSVKDLVKSKIEDFPIGGEVSNTMKKAQQLLSGKPNLRKLQNAKLEIDQMIGRIGEGSLGNTTKRELIDVKNTLLDRMDKFSPDFKTARETFALESPAVKAMEDSIIGKVSKFKDTDLKRISGEIFNPAETNPKIISDAKKTIKAVDPYAWNELLRTELEKRIGYISDDVAEGGLGSIENIPQYLERRLFGNPKQRKTLFMAVDGETKKNLRYLETALKRAKLGRPGGSQTAIREEIKKELRGGLPQALRDLFRRPVSRVMEIGEDVSFDNRVRALAEALYNPEYKKPMEKLRSLNSNGSAAAKSMTQLIKTIEEASRDNTNNK